jgi:hypothetical protein
MRAVLTAFAIVFVVVLVFVLIHSGEARDSAKAVVTVKQVTPCRMICRCEPGQPCEMANCYEDCHPADPKACVPKMLCPDAYVWSKTECSCLRR